MHSTIEQAKKITLIFIPSQWDTIITMARKKKPCIVVPLRFKNFYDLQKLAKEIFGNLKTTTGNKRVSLGNIKTIKLDKNEGDIVNIKYSYYDTEFQKINVERK